MKGTSMKCVLLIAGLAGSLVAASPTNVLTNGGFEANPNGAAYGWNLSLNGGDSVAATRVIDSTTGNAQEGKNFCRVAVTKVSTQNWHAQLMDPSWPAKNGYVYHYSIWARADSARTMQISVYGDASSIYTYRTSTTINLTKEWQQFHQIFTADAEGIGKINFALVCGGAIGVYDFDNAVITEAVPNGIYQNGSFEADGAGWNLWVNKTDSSTGAATMSFPTTGAKSGDKFCRIDVTSKPKAAYEVQLQDGTWKCEQYFKYTFKIWVKADSARDIKIEAQAGSTLEYASLAAATFTLSTAWQACSLSYTFLDSGGTDFLNFVIHCGAAAGKYDFDSASLIGALDTTMVHPIRDALNKATRQFIVQLFPEHLQCRTDAAMTVPLKADIFSVQGRLFSTTAITTAGRAFNLPRPPSGAWIVRVGSERSNMVVIP